MRVAAVALEGKRVRLEPLTRDHLPALTVAGAHSELWRWTQTQADTPEGMAAYLNAALSAAASGSALPFVTIDKASAQVIGSTRFASIDMENRKVEIGWTWITPAFQRTHVNSEAKYLMLSHAFEVWGCVRVELKTDFLNSKSRAAMERIGAVEEGTLRKHMLMYGGRFRDSTYYSVLDTEWAAVKSRLEGFMVRRRGVTGESEPEGRVSAQGRE